MPENLQMKKYSVLRNMKRKIKREWVVRTDPKSRKEAESHKKSTRGLQPGKQMKETRNPVEAETNQSPMQNTVNQKNWGQGLVRPINEQWEMGLKEPIWDDPQEVTTTEVFH